MLRTLVVIGALALTPAVALAQANTSSTPGHKMQRNDKAAPGASEYAPGHQPNTKAGPGHSESAPGQMKNKATGMPNNPRTGTSRKTDGSTGR
jgi:hypothetical protein